MSGDVIYSTEGNRIQKVCTCKMHERFELGNWILNALRMHLRDCSGNVQESDGTIVHVLMTRDIGSREKCITTVHGSTHSDLTASLTEFKLLDVCRVAQGWTIKAKV